MVLSAHAAIVRVAIVALHLSVDAVSVAVASWILVDHDAIFGWCMSCKAMLNIMLVPLLLYMIIMNHIVLVQRGLVIASCHVVARRIVCLVVRRGLSPHAYQNKLWIFWS